MYVGKYLHNHILIVLFPYNITMRMNNYINVHAYIYWMYLDANFERQCTRACTYTYAHAPMMIMYCNIPTHVQISCTYMNMLVHHHIYVFMAIHVHIIAYTIIKPFIYINSIPLVHLHTSDRGCLPMGGCNPCANR